LSHRDLNMVKVGTERYEIPDAVVLGGQGISPRAPTAPVAAQRTALDWVAAASARVTQRD
jgi:hypothetical protein